MASRGRGRGRGGRGNWKPSDDGWADQGGYMNAKIQKLESQIIVQPEKKSDIFHGVAIFVNGYTKPPQDELKRLMLAHGGTYVHFYARTKVTHIVASNLPTSKIRELREEKVVSPQWITDSVESGRLLPYQTYLLYPGSTRHGRDLVTCLKRSNPNPTANPLSATRPVAKCDQLTPCDLKGDSSLSLRTEDLETDALAVRIDGVDYGGESERDELTFDDDDDGDRGEDEERFGEKGIHVKDNAQHRCDGTYWMDDEEMSDEVSGTSWTNDKLMMSDDDDYLLESANIDSHESNNASNGASVIGPRDNSISSASDTLLPHSNSVICASAVSNPVVIQNSVTAGSTNLTSIVPARPRPVAFHSAPPTKSSTTGGATLTAGDPAFVAEFYGHSRLHHIATWGTECKAYVAELRTLGGVTGREGGFEGREALIREVREAPTAPQGVGVEGGGQQVVMHIDMDCFFVSVGLLTRPELKGKPVAVTHSTGRGPTKSSASTKVEEDYWKKRLGETRLDSATAAPSMQSVSGLGGRASGVLGNETNSKAEIASCSYEARQAGVKNGMFFGTARKLCPELMPIPYDFEEYKRISCLLYDTVASYTHDIEAVSCDELYVDCTALLARTGCTALKLATRLRSDVHQRTGCTASAGLGGNRLQARLATRLAKPNGHYYLEAHGVTDFMRNIPVKDLPGVGYVLAKKLKALDVRTCTDLQRLSLASLQKQLGVRTGSTLYGHARGQDDRPIKMVVVERKSVSAEINYGIRFKKQVEADDFLLQLGEELHSRLVKVKMRGKVVTLKLKVRQEDAPKETAKFLGHGIVDSLSRSSTLPSFTDSADIIARECHALLRQLNVAPEDLRGIGIQMTHLESAFTGISAQPAAAAAGCRSIRDFVTGVIPSTSVTTGTKTGTIITKHSGTDLILNDVRRNLAKTTTQAKITATMTGPRESGSNRNLVSSLGERPGKESSESDASAVAPSRTSAHGAPPPLPVLPTEDLDEGGAERGQKGGRSSPPAANELLLPSASQIDASVMEQLPIDVRREIEAALHRRDNQGEQSRRIHGNQMPNDKTKTLPRQLINPPIEDDKPGCSHWRGGRSASLSDWVEKGGEMFEASASEDNPLSYSQLDLSFLNAMPDDIRDELRHTYGPPATDRDPLKNHPDDQEAAGSTKEKHSATLHPLMRPENKISPQKLKTDFLKSPPISPSRKGASPSKKEALPSEKWTSPRAKGLSPKGKGASPNGKGASPKGKSPGFKIPRGRPAKRGRKGKQLVFGKLNEMAGGSVEPSITNAASLKIALPTGRAPASDTVALPSSEGVGSGVVAEVSLAGRVSTDDIKPLLLEWTRSSQAPCEADLDILETFFLQLVQHRLLERVDILLKYLVRLSRRGLLSLSWERGTRVVIDRTQATIECLYGGTLRL